MSMCMGSSTGGISSGEFYECDSHVLALGYIGMTLGAYRWLRPSGTPQRQGNRRRVQHRTAAGSDPRRVGPCGVTARRQNWNRYIRS